MVRAPSSSVQGPDRGKQGPLLFVHYRLLKAGESIAYTGTVSDADGNFLIEKVPFGTYQIEAMACGVPVVQPRAGAFTEVVEDTGGGLLYDPADPENLTSTLRDLLRDPTRATALGEHGRKAVRARYGVDVTARQHIDLYHSLLEAKS